MFLPPVLGGAAAYYAVSRAVGPSISASLALGEERGTCEFGAASVVVVTEEGVGRCFYYPYASAEDAAAKFPAWSPASRIVFRVEDGIVTEELRCKGLHSMPYNTIRRAAQMCNICGKVFVCSGRLGRASYHFSTSPGPLGPGGGAFVSYESDECSSWRLDDGSPLPPCKAFEDAVYDPAARCFRGNISWAPTSFCGDARWEYEMRFDATLSCIEGGQIHHYTPGLTDRDAPRQSMPYGEGGLVYMRWRGSAADSPAPPTRPHGPASTCTCTDDRDKRW